MAPQLRRQTPSTCPVCGEDVPRGALACPECGADHNSGWREDATLYDGTILPEDFDYGDFTKREFGSSLKPRGIRTLWWMTAAVLFLLVILYFIAAR